MDKVKYQLYIKHVKWLEYQLWAQFVERVEYQLCKQSRMSGVWQTHEWCCKSGQLRWGPRLRTGPQPSWLLAPVLLHTHAALNPRTWGKRRTARFCGPPPPPRRRVTRLHWVDFGSRSLNSEDWSDSFPATSMTVCVLILYVYVCV